MNILITGATGFIGASFTRSALAQGLRVRATGRRGERLAALASLGAEVRQGDLLDPDFALQLCQGMDAVVHCAGLGGHWGRLADFEQANLGTTENVVEGCIKAQVRRLVYLSSAQIYQGAPSAALLREDQLPARKACPQAQTRFRAEQRVFGAEEFGLQVVALRPAPVLGEGEPWLWPGLFQLCARGRLRLLGDGLNRVDFTSQANLEHALLAALFAEEEALGRVYNIANDQALPFWDVLNYGLRQLRLPPLRDYRSVGLARLGVQFGTLARLVWPGRPRPPLTLRDLAWITRDNRLDISRARQYLGYQPQASVWIGMDALCQGWRAQDTTGKYR